MFRVDGIVCCSVALLVLGVPLASAHAAPPGPEYYKRQVHDCNDDWGGHSTANDGHDLIALDAAERFNATVSDDLVVAYVTMNGGYAAVNSAHPVLKETFTITVNAKPYTADLVTTDNRVFTSTGADFINGPLTVYAADGGADGTRFAVEIGFKYARLGAKLGDTVVFARVDGYAGSNKADYMPGGYFLNGAEVKDCPPGDTTLYSGAGYKLEGTSQKFFTASMDTTALAGTPDGMYSKDGTVASKLTKLGQEVAATVSGPVGWSFHVAPSSTFTLNKSASSSFTIHFMPGGAPQPGTATIRLSSDAGGFNQFAVPLTVVTPTPSTTNPSTTTPSKTGASAAGLDAVPILLAIVALARLRRG